MALPTQWKPTITAGTRQTRSFRTGFGDGPYKYRTALQVYNRDATATLILYIGGDEVRRIAPGDLGVFDEDTQIPYYELDATANTAANMVEVDEYGGLDEPVGAVSVPAVVS